jgi:hypothetical protein
MPWFHILLLSIVLVAVAAKVATMKRKTGGPGGNLPKTEKKPPWWFYGFQLAFFCLFTYYLFFRTETTHQDNYHLAIMGIFLCVMLVQFIREFIAQHAQFSIKSIMLLTLGVAVLCSIYSCFGLDVVILILLTAGMLISLWFQNRKEK